MSSTKMGDKLAALKKLKSRTSKKERFTNKLKEILTLTKSALPTDGKNKKQMSTLDKKIDRLLASSFINPNIVKKKTFGGFDIPCKIHPKLAAFLDIDPSEKRSRTEIMKALNTYIKENDLQNPLSKKMIRPDAILADLFNYDDEFSFVEMQTLIKKNNLIQSAKCMDKN